MKHLFAFIALLTWLFTSNMLSAQATNPGILEAYVQQDFLISAWGDMPIDAYASENYADMAAAGFNTILNFYVRDEKNILRQLDIAHRHGMKAMVYRGEEDFSQGDEALERMLIDHPACIGYLLADEPKEDRFEKIALQTEVIRRLRPGKLAYVNLHPKPAYGNYYETYLENFLSVCRPDLLSVDHYPRFGQENEAETMAMYCENLEIVRRLAFENHLPFWWFFYSSPHLLGELLEPTEGQLSWQAYMAITHGARGLLYFTYWRPPFAGERSKKDSALLDSRYNKNRLYDKAKRLNAGISNLGPTLMRLQSEQVFRIGPDHPATATSSPLPEISFHEPEEKERALNLMIGTFRHEDGRTFFMVTNYEHAYTSWVTLRLRSNEWRIIEVDKRTGREKPVYDESVRLDDLQISLDAGEGRLFAIEPQPLNADESYRAALESQRANRRWSDLR